MSNSTNLITFFSRNIKLLFIINKHQVKSYKYVNKNCKLNRYSHKKIHLFSLPFIINNIKSSYIDKYIWSPLKTLIEMIIWHSCTLVSLLPLYDINAKVITSYILYYIILQKKRRSQSQSNSHVLYPCSPFLSYEWNWSVTTLIFPFFEGWRCSLRTS